MSSRRSRYGPIHSVETTSAQIGATSKAVDVSDPRLPPEQADARSSSRLIRNIDFVIFPDALLLDLAGPLQVFELANETSATRGSEYRISICSAEGGLIRTSSGVEIMTSALAAPGPADTVVVAGGNGVYVAADDALLTTWMASQASSARRICSVCTGAFVLAASGLLEGRQAVTHWGSCSRLQTQHPSTTVLPDAIYVQDGQVWTSAGATAGIDLALALVEEDCGRSEAIRIARKLVVFLKRPGGQTQYSMPLRLQADGDGSFDKLHDWIQLHLGDDLRVEVLAAEAGMSPRTFARLYAERTGRTPAKAVEGLRLEAACRTLEDTRLTVKEVAVRCGFLEEDRMRRCFHRSLGVSPQEYRARFC